MDVFNWVMAHGAEIVAALVAVHAAAVAIVNLTPTPKDDEVVAKAYVVIEWLAGIFTPKAKQ